MFDFIAEWFNDFISKGWGCGCFVFGVWVFGCFWGSTFRCSK